MSAIVGLLAILFFGAILFQVMRSVVDALAGTSRPSFKKRRGPIFSDVLRPVKERFNAEPERASQLGQMNFRRPGLSFDYGRTVAKLWHYGNHWRPLSARTSLEMQYPDAFGNLLQIAGRTPNPHDTKRWTANVETGDDTFDAQFVVRSDHPEQAKQLLAPAIRWKLIELEKLTGKGCLQLSLQNDVLTVTYLDWFSTGRPLLDFVQGSLEIFDQLMLYEAEGLEFLQQNQAAVIGEVRCPICSDDVMHDMVVCRRCKTPHCAECWEYNGKCATFACMEDRCVRVEGEVV
jgi:hypothetical protein